MPKSLANGFELPNGFDIVSYDKVNEQAAILTGINNTGASWEQNSWFGYASAWNGVAIRLRSAIEYDAEFGHHISISTAPEYEVLYAQERALFDCITATLSCIECFYVATYCLGSVISPKNFPLQIPKDLNKYPHQVADSYHKWSSGDSFSQLLSTIANSKECKALSELRNTLSHRGVLVREVYLSTVSDTPANVPSNPKSLANDFNFDAPLSSQTTSVHVNWVSQTTSHLTTSLSQFLALYT